VLVGLSKSLEATLQGLVESLRLMRVALGSS